MCGQEYFRVGGKALILLWKWRIPGGKMGELLHYLAGLWERRVEGAGLQPPTRPTGGAPGGPGAYVSHAYFP